MIQNLRPDDFETFRQLQRPVPRLLMPILWTYILSQYLRMLFLCIAAFITVLVTTRLDEIAHFATLGSEGRYIFLFFLYQIPYVLPIALPISALISSILLLQSMSDSQELTAMRAAGRTLKDILMPMLLAAFLLSLFSFYVVSELATKSHLHTSLLKSELRSINPLLMLSNKHIMKLKGIHYDTLGSSKMGESASSVVIAMPNKHYDRLNLMIAKTMRAAPSHFIAENLSLISSLPTIEKQPGADLLAIENIQKATTTVEDFSRILQKKVWNLNNDHLSLPLLLVRLFEYKQALLKAEKIEIQASSSTNQSSIDVKAHRESLQQSLNRTISEIVRRISLATAVISFTLMGASFGISISRLKSNRGLFFVVGLTGLFLASYFSATGMDHLLPAAITLYLAPHVIIMTLSIWMLCRTAKGIE